MDPEQGDNVGSYVQMFAKEGLSGEITRLESALIQNKKYGHLKPLHLSAFAAYLEAGNLEGIRSLETQL